ncbi:probable WRKY transcription factor 53 isoform X2 [Gastrolobium bilobum]|uniref:probable WRKY transcription factor 53 isoform X2 n=1 Tax=Gastrolobium bilobum TaxID=150636 RepID=UPI002AB15BF8|nr:probable WRKY transcription factor 53 isoform X2 [Gastrolobium bilobum]
MENNRSWEQNALFNELFQGMEIARKLKEDLTLPSSADTRDLLVQRILSSYDKALLILRWNASISKSQTMHQATKTLSPESPVSAKRSPPMEDIDGGLMDHQELKHDSKKRKTMPKWKDQIRVKFENGFEWPHEDGFNWRKYGQKDILGAKYPRSYYRCTFRNTKGCWATKQVQRTDEDPTIFDITYRGSHTCSQGTNAVLPPKSPDIQEKPHGHKNDVCHAQPSQESLTKFRNTLTVNTVNLGNEETAQHFTSTSNSFGCLTQDNHTLFPSVLENDPFLSSLSQTHLSPNTPESNYFLTPSFLIDEFDGICNKPCPDSDITEIVTANTSATNYSIFDFNFSLDVPEIDPDFPFNASGFFS